MFRGVKLHCNNFENVALAPGCVFLTNFLTPLFRGRMVPTRIKWNYLLLSHQRKVVDSAKDLEKVRKDGNSVHLGRLYGLMLTV